MFALVDSGLSTFDTCVPDIQHNGAKAVLGSRDASQLQEGIQKVLGEFRKRCAPRLGAPMLRHGLKLTFATVCVSSVQLLFSSVACDRLPSGDIAHGQLVVLPQAGDLKKSCPDCCT